MKSLTSKIAIAALLTLGTTAGIVSTPVSALAQGAQSVNDLRDVTPNDWAYTAVKGMVERYGCLAGYPDGTFRGNRSMTRYEFAAALNGCIDTINQQIRDSLIEVTANDLATMQQLQSEFQAELATLRGRVDSLEERTAELEKTQSGIKLGGELVTDVGSVFSGEAGPGDDSEDGLTAAARLRLSFDSEILGNDKLHAQVQATNIEGYAGRFENGNSFNGLDTPYDDEGDSSVSLDELYYQRNLGPGQLTVGTHGVEIETIAGTETAPSGQYAFIEQFEANPAIAEAGEGAGIGYKLNLNKNLALAASHIVPTDEAADTNDGLLGGTNATTAKLTYTPGENMALSVAYARTQEQGVAAGTAAAANPFGGNDTNGNHVGLSAARKIGRVDLSAHGGVSFLGDDNSADEATVVNWAAQLGVNDLFGEGHYGGIGVGAVPYVTGGDVASEDMPLAAQAFYSLKVNDGLAIQPQVVYINNPNGNDNNDSVWAGSIKTTLRF